MGSCQSCEMEVRQRTDVAVYAKINRAEVKQESSAKTVETALLQLELTPRQCARLVFRLSGIKKFTAWINTGALTAAQRKNIIKYSEGKGDDFQGVLNELKRWT